MTTAEFLRRLYAGENILLGIEVVLGEPAVLTGQ